MSSWSTGDRIVHAGRPEWGIGHVSSAQDTTQDGRPCQRITARFDRVGVKTLSTAFAELKAPSDGAQGNNGSGSDDGWLAALETDPQEVLESIPDDATDPFSLPLDRLRRTLDLYRFTPSGGSLLDWAAVQTGLKDPLSQFNRHQLEEAFQRFRLKLDSHLKQLLLDLKRTEPAAVSEVIAKAPADGQQVLRRLHAMR